MSEDVAVRKDPMETTRQHSVLAERVRIETFPLHVKLTFGEQLAGSGEVQPIMVVTLPLNTFMDTVTSMNQVAVMYRAKQATTSEPKS